MRGAGSRKPGRRVQLRQVERMIRTFSELEKVLELGPPVPVPERMHVVHVADDFSGADGEGWKIETAQETRGAEAAANVSHPGLDETTELELMAILADLDDAQLAGPVIDVLKEGAMDGLQVREVEIAVRRALAAALNCKPAFEIFQTRLISDVQLVSQHKAAGVDVRIVCAHSAASWWASARINARQRSCDHRS